MDFLTFPNLFSIARDEMLSRNSNLTREVIEKPGSDANAVTAGAAATGDAVMGQLVEVYAGLYLDSAQGIALDRLIFDRYGLTRKPASAALGSVTWTAPAPLGSGFAIPVNTRLTTQDGRTFTTTQNVSFPTGFTSVETPVRSTQAGANQQASIGTITNIQDYPAGAPTGLTVTNPAATAGAGDAELDPSYRARARAFFTTARRGTLAAIQAAAIGVPGVVTATAFEVLDAYGLPAKDVQLVVADAFTQVLVSTVPTPPAYQTQSNVLAAAVFLALDDVRAAGINVEVLVADVTLLGVVLALTFQAGVNVETVSGQARAAIVGYVNNLAPGNPFIPADAVTALKRVAGLKITGNEILSPPGVVAPNNLEVLRTTMGLVVSSAAQLAGAA